jgi:glyoxylase-like metal-dependent hydrolase (beta-lactamase superfamily II)
MAKGWKGMRILGTVAAMMVWCAICLRAQEPLLKTYEDVTKVYHTEKLAEGIYAFIAPEPRTQVVSGNSVAVIGSDGVLVVDSGNIPSLTRRMIGEIRRLTDKPVRFVVNTHWHPDHSMGNAVYREEFPGVAILSTEFTRRAIAEEVPRYIQGNTGPGIDKYVESMKEMQKSGKHADGTPLAEEEKLYIPVFINDIESILPEFRQTKYVGPNMGFEQAVNISLGNREVKVMWLGRGNTGGDAVIYVPDSKVVMTGDLVVSPTPYSFGSYLTEWVETLKKLMALDATTIVPGHGLVQHDWGYVKTLVSMLESVTSQVRAAVKQKLSLEDTRKKVDLESFRKLLCGDSVWRNGGFRIAFLEPAVERAYQEAKFASED